MPWWNKVQSHKCIDDVSLRLSLKNIAHREHNKRFTINLVIVGSLNLLQRMRVAGSGLIIAAYFITLNLDVVTGVAVHLTAMVISVPYFIKSKAWDVVIMMTFLMTIGTGRLVTAAI